jgi:hypothetical protein
LGIHAGARQKTTQHLPVVAALSLGRTFNARCPERFLDPKSFHLLDGALDARFFLLLHLLRNCVTGRLRAVTLPALLILPIVNRLSSVAVLRRMDKS